ncbi:MAG TPA: hypothetical protein VL501_03070 [Pyrinomonadaceae bacterium]|nr:hypothetical protein [Pyrinomonadaceae bacterium]
MKIMTTWNIYTSGGQYIGQCEADTAEIAFVRCMELKGPGPTANAFRTSMQKDGTFVIDHNGESFILKKTMSAAPPIS